MQPCGKTKSIGVRDAEATGEGDTLGEADAGIGEAIVSDDVAGVPQADTPIPAAIRSTVITLTAHDSRAALDHRA